jgi:peroxiredoxin
MTSDTLESIPPARRYPATADFPTGPGVGEAFPDASLINQRGETVGLHALRAGRPALVVFHRSAQWCAFCRSQVRALQDHHAAYEAAGVALFAISYDAVPHLAQFAGEFGVDFPLLSDQDSAFIKRLGILNTLIEPDEPRYGIPFPGAYALDASGQVIAKYFYQHYRERPAPLAVLRETFGASPDLSDCPSAEASGDGWSLSATLAAPILAPFQHTPIYVRLDGASDVAVTSDQGDLEVGEPARASRGGHDEVRVPVILRSLEVESVSISVTPAGPADARAASLTVRVGELNRPQPAS